MARSTLRPSPGLTLPPSFTLIDDADEEIFLLYTRKLSLSSRKPSPSTSSSTNAAAGLGFLDTTQQVLPISLTFRSPHPATALAPVARGATDGAGKREKGARRRKAKQQQQEEEEEKAIEFELLQDLEALRHRKGDTGSVLWRVSLHLALHLLRHLSFPSSLPSPALLPSLFLPPLLSSNSSAAQLPAPPVAPRQPLTILELGSGTGFLGIALLPLLASLHPELAGGDAGEGEEGGAGGGGRGGVKWIFSDQAANLPLLAKNLRRNEGRLDGNGEKEVREVDWLATPASSTVVLQGADEEEDATAGAGQVPKTEADIILAADCLYNPSLSLPLARTIHAHSVPFSARESDTGVRGRGTIVVVASELRDEQALREFLAGWLELPGWKIGRVGSEWQGEAQGEEGEEEEGLWGREFVVWAGWRAV